MFPTLFILLQCLALFSSPSFVCLTFSRISAKNDLLFSPSPLQWVPRHSFFPGKHKADALTRWGTLLKLSTLPSSLSLLSSHIHPSRFSNGLHTISSKFFDIQVPSVCTKKLVNPRQDRCVLLYLRFHGNSLLLNYNFSKMSKNENLLCNTCSHPTQDTAHLILHCPATVSLPRLLFGIYFSLYDLRSKPWGVALVLGLHGLPPFSHLLKGGKRCCCPAKK